MKQTFFRYLKFSSFSSKGLLFLYGFLLFLLFWSHGGEVIVCCCEGLRIWVNGSIHPSLREIATEKIFVVQDHERTKLEKSLFLVGRTYMFL